MISDIWLSHLRSSRQTFSRCIQVRDPKCLDMTRYKRIEVKSSPPLNSELLLVYAWIEFDCQLVLSGVRMAHSAGMCLESFAEQRAELCFFLSSRQPQEEIPLAHFSVLERS